MSWKKRRERSDDAFKNMEMFRDRSGRFDQTRLRLRATNRSLLRSALHAAEKTRFVESLAHIHSAIGFENRRMRDGGQILRNLPYVLFSGDPVQMIEA